MLIQQSTTAYTLMFFMNDSTDHVTGKTGLTPTVTLSKAGAAFGSPAGAVTEVANGWYKVAGNATDSNTLGLLVLHATGTAADPTDMIVGEVVAFNPQVNFSTNAAAGASGGLHILGTNAVAVSYTAGVTISNASGSALTLSSSGSNGNGLAASGNGTGDGIMATAGATGRGIHAVGGVTSGAGIRAEGTAGNANALELAGQGSAHGLSATGGATGNGILATGGATSGSAVKAIGTNGNAIALELVGQGSAQGLKSTGGATGNGVSFIGGSTSGHGLQCTVTSGNEIDADRVGTLTGNITGSLSGSVGSVTARVTANTDQVNGVAWTATAGIPSVNLVQWKGSAPADLIANRVDVTLGATQTGAITAGGIAADAIGASELAADAVTEIRDSIFAKIVETNGSYTLDQVISVMFSVVAGRTASGTFKTPDNVATRAVFGYTGNDRTSVTITAGP